MSLELAMRRHGGLALWKKLESIDLELVSLGGPLPLTKGLGITFMKPDRITVYPGVFKTVFHDFPTKGSIGIYDGGRAGIFTDGVRDPQFDNPDYRLTFTGWGKFRQWKPVDALYFFGYALSIYLGLPFVLQGKFISTVESQDGFKIEAEFPREIHTHSARQTFYFDRSGLLQRNDYTADVVSQFASGAHMSEDYVEVNGLQLAKRRRVFARLGSVATPIPVLSADLEFIQVNVRK